MTKLHLIVWVGLLMLASAAQAQTSFRNPELALDEAVKKAEQHVRAEKIDVTNSYIDAAVLNQNPRGDRGKFWLITWQRKEFLKGGQLYVRIYMNGTVEHSVGE